LVRKAFSSGRAQVVASAAFVTIALAWPGSRAQAAAEMTGAAAVAEALLWGRTMPPPQTTASLPFGIQHSLTEYRKREASFRSGLTRPPGATSEELRLFEQRVGIERVVFCLFPRRDSARVAALYALDVDVSLTWEGASELPRREAAFIDELLSDLPQPWLAPYLNLIAAHRRLCASELDAGAPDTVRGAWLRDAQRQLALAQVRGGPLIQFVAEFVATAARPCSPSL
jgi:hypothetical protein